MRKVFISYCHRDNRPHGPVGLQWVDVFSKALEANLGQHAGEGAIEIWRDRSRLDGNTLHDEEIVAQLNSSDLLIPILSQHLLQSEYCRRELEHFGTRWIRSGSLHLGNGSRILKVYRSPIEARELKACVVDPRLAQELEDSAGWNVYGFDEKGNHRDALLDQTGITLIWLRTDDLARTIKRMLAGRPEAEEPDPRRAVYLAWTTPDQRDARDNLRRELEAHGYRVLPDLEEPPPRHAAACEKRARELLAKSRASVHLLGRHDGSVLEGRRESALSLQATLAMEAQHRLAFSLFWTPWGRGEIDARMAELAERVRHDGRAEYVRSSIGKLKLALLRRLTELDLPAPEARARSVFLIGSPSSSDEVAALQRDLEGCGFEVRRALDATPHDCRWHRHRQLLAGCDIAVVVFGDTCLVSWLLAQVRELRAVPGRGRERPLESVVVEVGHHAPRLGDSIDGIPVSTPSKLLRRLRRRH